MSERTGRTHVPQGRNISRSPQRMPESENIQEQAHNSIIHPKMLKDSLTHLPHMDGGWRERTVKQLQTQQGNRFVQRQGLLGRAMEYLTPGRLSNMGSRALSATREFMSGNFAEGGGGVMSGLQSVAEPYINQGMDWLSGQASSALGWDQSET